MLVIINGLYLEKYPDWDWAAVIKVTEVNGDISLIQTLL